MAPCSCWWQIYLKMSSKYLKLQTQKLANTSRKLSQECTNTRRTLGSWYSTAKHNWNGEEMFLHVNYTNIGKHWTWTSITALRLELLYNTWPSDRCDWLSHVMTPPPVRHGWGQLKHDKRGLGLPLADTSLTLKVSALDTPSSRTRSSRKR